MHGTWPRSLNRTAGSSTHFVLKRKKGQKLESPLITHTWGGGEDGIRKERTANSGAFFSSMVRHQMTHQGTRHLSQSLETSSRTI